MAEVTNEQEALEGQSMIVRRALSSALGLLLMALWTILPVCQPPHQAAGLMKVDTVGATQTQSHGHDWAISDFEFDEEESPDQDDRFIGILTAGSHRRTHFQCLSPHPSYLCSPPTKHVHNCGARSPPAV